MVRLAVLRGWGEQRTPGLREEGRRIRALRASRRPLRWVPAWSHQLPDPKPGQVSDPKVGPLERMSVVLVLSVLSVVELALRLLVLLSAVVLSAELLSLLPRPVLRVGVALVSSLGRKVLLSAVLLLLRRAEWGGRSNRSSGCSRVRCSFHPRLAKCCCCGRRSIGSAERQGASPTACAARAFLRRTARPYTCTRRPYTCGFDFSGRPYTSSHFK